MVNMIQFTLAFSSYFIILFFLRWQTKLKDSEAIAKAALKGKWSTDLPHLHVRDIKNQIENPTNFVDSLKKQPVKAIVEHVRDGSTVRVLLLPDFYNVLVLVAGIKVNLFLPIKS